MGKFNVIAGVGHCGTMWLSRVLDEATDTRWFHELRLQRGGPWLDTLRYGPGDRQYDAYWSAIRKHLKSGDVGDANSWPPVLLPDVNEVQPIDRIIYMRRNPIQQLHSLATRSYVWSQQRLPGIVEKYLNDLRLRGTVFAGLSLPDLASMTRWERLCLLVASNYFMPDWLRRHAFSVKVVSLNTLTTDIGALQALAPRLSEDAVRRWQMTDVNRKVTGDRSPDALWAKWTDEQKAGFERVVAPAMAQMELV